jgi:uncharacterized C2H2 Zn-finger protein
MSKKYTTEEFIKKAKNIHGNKYDYCNTNYINAISKITIGCYEHGIFNLRAGDHLFGYGCPKCNKMYVNTEKFIRKANLVHNDLYNYSLVEYINAKTKIRILCKIHGEFLQRTSDHLNGRGCPHCINSQGEKLIAKFLTEKNIAYETEKKFSECKGKKRILPFDFYISKYNLLIEFDGQQHFNIINYWGGIDKFKKQQKTDEIKNNFAKNNNIGLLRIKYNEINNINQLLKEII